MSGKVNSTGAVSGVIGTTVGAAGATSGMVSNVFKFLDTSSGTQTNTSSTTAYVATDAKSFSAVSGRHYIIAGTQACSPRGDSSTSKTERFQTMKLYYGTTDRSIGDTTLDTSIMGDGQIIGRHMDAASTGEAANYINWAYISYFTAGSTATHYVYTVVRGFTGIITRAYNDGDNVHHMMIYEVMP